MTGSEDMNDADTSTSAWSERLAQRGVPLTGFKGAAVPVGLGALRDELAAARAGAAVIELAWQGHLTVRGRHRARFVHNMTTCQVKSLRPGAGNFGLLVNDKGRLVAQLHIDTEADALCVETGREDIERVIAQLTRYRVADDVRFERDDRWSVVALLGPQAAGRLEQLGVSLRGLDVPSSWRDTSLAGEPVRVRRSRARLGAGGWDLRVGREGAPRVIEALTTAGATAIGLDAWSALRVTAGWPADGVDLSEDNLPLEAQALYDTIDWDKGCYIGQEVLAMTHYRGRPSRRLVAVLPQAGATLTTGDALVAAPDDARVGRLGTVALLPGRGPVALAVVKRKHADPGTRLALGDGTAVVVEALPLGAQEASS